MSGPFTMASMKEGDNPRLQHAHQPAIGFFLSSHIVTPNC
jgi:hypothetical protein